MERDGLDEAAVLDRMAAQMPEAEKRRLADVILENDGDLPGFLAQVDSCYAQVRR